MMWSSAVSNESWMNALMLWYLFSFCYNFYFSLAFRGSRLSRTKKIDTALPLSSCVGQTFPIYSPFLFFTAPSVSFKGGKWGRTVSRKDADTTKKKEEKVRTLKRWLVAIIWPELGTFNLYIHTLEEFWIFEDMRLWLRIPFGSSHPILSVFPFCCQAGQKFSNRLCEKNATSTGKTDHSLVSIHCDDLDESEFASYLPSMFFASIVAAVSRKLRALFSACFASHRRKEIKALAESLIALVKIPQHQWGLLRLECTYETEMMWNEKREWFPKWEVRRKTSQSVAQKRISIHSLFTRDWKMATFSIFVELLTHCSRSSTTMTRSHLEVI